MKVKLEENQRISTKDDERAETIRSLVCSLSEEVGAAKASGLRVELKLGTLGEPGWIGYQDAVIITRKF